jgi:hypothetical protein
MAAPFSFVLSPPKAIFIAFLGAVKIQREC